MHGLLKLLNAAPVLVDIGASDGPPSVWEAIAGAATYVGFDPDRREITSIEDGRFRRSVIVNEAVIADPGAREALFHLTRSPYCSSTLEPDKAALANYHFAGLFETERQVAVPAATLDAILARLGVERVDWIKCDTQGTDLRIFTSLSERLRRDVLALDVEPGLVDAYRGEDLFPDTHKHLAANGFWLSRLDVKGAIRVRPATLRAVFPGVDSVALVERTIRAAPGWCEARYLRTLESLESMGSARDRYALLFIFALLDGQPGFALDTALEYERRFGGDECSARMRAEAASRIVHPWRHAIADRAQRLIGRVRRRGG